MEGYKHLSTYILATVICDLNVGFIKRWINYKSRTCDQMEQVFDSEGQSPQAQTRRAGRSGKQNIAEGYMMQSLESYIKLLGVAEGSIKELAADYEDFLRQKKLSTWSKNDGRVRGFRAFRAVWIESNIPNTPNLPNNPEEAANMLLTFCQMESYLLSRQIAALKEKFIEQGGFRENLFKKRVEYLKNR